MQESFPTPTAFLHLGTTANPYPISSSGGSTIHASATTLAAEWDFISDAMEMDFCLPAFLCLASPVIYPHSDTFHSRQRSSACPRCLYCRSETLLEMWSVLRPLTGKARRPLPLTRSSFEGLVSVHWTSWPGLMPLYSTMLR
jgi:hypothetical protein